MEFCVHVQHFLFVNVGVEWGDGNAITMFVFQDIFCAFFNKKTAIFALFLKLKGDFLKLKGVFLALIFVFVLIHAFVGQVVGLVKSVKFVFLSNAKTE